MFGKKEKAAVAAGVDPRKSDDDQTPTDDKKPEGDPKLQEEEPPLPRKKAAAFKAVPEEPKRSASPGRRQLLASQDEPVHKLAKTAGITADAENDDLVTAVVPKAFRLTCDDGKVVEYQVGIQDMPTSHAKHWWSQAQGVTIKE